MEATRHKHITTPPEAICPRPSLPLSSLWAPRGAEEECGKENVQKQLLREQAYTWDRVMNLKGGKRGGYTRLARGYLAMTRYCSSVTSASFHCCGVRGLGLSTASSPVEVTSCKS